MAATNSDDIIGVLHQEEALMPQGNDFLTMLDGGDEFLLDRSICRVDLRELAEVVSQFTLKNIFLF